MKGEGRETRRSEGADTSVHPSRSGSIAPLLRVHMPCCASRGRMDPNSAHHALMWEAMECVMCCPVQLRPSVPSQHADGAGRSCSNTMSSSRQLPDNCTVVVKNLRSGDGERIKSYCHKRTPNLTGGFAVVFEKKNPPFDGMCSCQTRWLSL